MKGRKAAVSPGVKAADFPSHPSPDQEATKASVVGGALSSNSNSNNDNDEQAPRGLPIIQDEAQHNVWQGLRRARS